MKKVSSQKYAQSLWQVAKGKPKSEIDKLVKNFILMLQKNNDFKKAKTILDDLTNIVNQAAQRVAVTVTSPKPLSTTEQNLITKKIKDKTDYKKIVINNQIDPDLIAGWQLKIGWQKLDNSLRTKLNNLKINLE